MPTEEVAMQPCAHPDCKCMAPEGHKFCSDFCRYVGGRPMPKCHCAHAGCGKKHEDRTAVTDRGGLV